MKTDKKDSYHHGNLRQTLLDAALTHLRTQSLDSLSLRGLAKTAGVSPTAVYSHFEDKIALLIEIRTLGFTELYHFLQNALGELGDASAEQKLRTLAYAYMRFGQDNPHIFDILFTWTPEFQRITHDCIEAGTDSEAVLRKVCVALLQECGDAPNERQAAIASFSAWSLVHGITTLIRSGSIEAAVYCGHWPENFSARHPESHAQIIEHLLSIQVEGLKAAVLKIPPEE